MRDYSGPAEILQGDQTISVSCSYAGSVDPVNGLRSWRGRFSTEGQLDIGQDDHELRLPDGTSGSILIDHLSVWPTSSGTFVGTGPWPGYQADALAK